MIQYYIRMRSTGEREVRERFWSPMCRAEVAGVHCHQRMCIACRCCGLMDLWGERAGPNGGGSSSMHPEIPIQYPMRRPCNYRVIMRTRTMLSAESTPSSGAADGDYKEFLFFRPASYVMP